MTLLLMLSFIYLYLVLLTSEGVVKTGIYIIIKLIVIINNKINNHDR